MSPSYTADQIKWSKCTDYPESTEKWCPGCFAWRDPVGNTGTVENHGWIEYWELYDLPEVGES